MRNENNRNLIEWNGIKNKIIDVCIVFHEFDLPAYILLEIIDWFSFFEYIEHKKKIQLIINVKKSCEKIKN